MAGIMLCDDLIFFSRVAGAARAMGLDVRQSRTVPGLLDMARREPPGGVLLDLHIEAIDLPNLLAELRAACPTMPRTVGFGSHVDAETLRKAREAGCDLVVPRSQFVKMLESSLPQWLAPPA